MIDVGGWRGCLGIKWCFRMVILEWDGFRETLCVFVQHSVFLFCNDFSALRWSMDGGEHSGAGILHNRSMGVVG